MSPCPAEGTISVKLPTNARLRGVQKQLFYLSESYLPHDLTHNQPYLRGEITFCSWVWNLDLDMVEGRVSQPPLNIQPRVLSPLRNFHGASSLLAELLTGATQGHPSRSSAGLIKGLPDSAGAQQSSSPAVIKSWSMFHYSFIYWWLSSSLPRLLLPSTSRHSIRDSVREIAPATGLLARSTTRVQSPAGHLEGPEAQLHQAVWWEKQEGKAWPQGERLASS